MMFEQEGDAGSEGFQMMGMINALKTGDMHVDMVIAMCVPFVLKMLFNWVGKLEDILHWEIWAQWFDKQPVEHERFISHCTTTDRWGGRCNADEDTQNSILLKAIKLYLHQVVRLDLLSAHLDLTGVDDKNYDGYYDYDYDSDDDVDFDSQKTLAGQLSRYKIVNRLPSNEWHEIGNYGKSQGPVRLRIECQMKTEAEDKNGSSGNQRCDVGTRNVENTTFHFLSPEKGAIDAFIDGAYNWYLGELRKMDDNSRYYYEMKVPDIKIGRNNDGGNGSDSITYKRYKLSEEKSFDSLFFSEKDSLLALIDHFTAKTGKYSIKGYPHKLGVLLHGPPGTGKTSLIKALAQYTGRSIVNVPLSKVTTNSELMSVFFDHKYRVEGAYVPVKLGFKDVIYVMEDCDAASKVVKRRDGKRPAELQAPAAVTLPAPKSLWRLLLESTSSACQEVVTVLYEKSERLRKEAEKERSDHLRSIAKRLNSQPALGLMDQAVENSMIAQACADAIESANERAEQRSKLDEILDSHAEAVKSLLDNGAEVKDDFVNELLGETRMVQRHVSPARHPSFSADYQESSCNVGSSGSPNIVDKDLLDASSADGKSVGKVFGAESSLFRHPDALSLSGLLNALDGVVDCPGRIVVLTSNHPQMLDPALIRPGRVDKTLMLGFMEAPDIVQMLELYYQTALSSIQIERIRVAVNEENADAVSQLKLTPAQIEQLAAKHDHLDDMITALEEQSPVEISEDQE